MISTPTRIDSQLLESRLAMRIAGALSTQLEGVPHDVSERLRFAREQALGKSREVRRAALVTANGPTVVGTSASGAASLGGFVPFWQRAASFAPLLILVAGLLLIDQWSTREQVSAAADIDAQLLADDLPPAAYGDAGFAEFLRSSPAP